MKKPANVITHIAIFSCLGFMAYSNAFAMMVDPTRPPGVIFTPQNYAASDGPLTLFAIFVYPSYRLAIIDGKIAKVGDHLGEFTISTINQDTVELLGPQNEKTVLTLVADIKQKSTQ